MARNEFGSISIEKYFRVANDKKSVRAARVMPTYISCKIGYYNSVPTSGHILNGWFYFRRGTGQAYRCRLCKDESALLTPWASSRNSIDWDKMYSELFDSEYHKAPNKQVDYRITPTYIRKLLEVTPYAVLRSSDTPLSFKIKCSYHNEKNNWNRPVPVAILNLGDVKIPLVSNPNKMDRVAAELSNGGSQTDYTFFLHPHTKSSIDALVTKMVMRPNASIAVFFNKDGFSDTEVTVKYGDVDLNFNRVYYRAI